MTIVRKGCRSPLGCCLAHSQVAAVAFAFCAGRYRPHHPTVWASLVIVVLTGAIITCALWTLRLWWDTRQNLGYKDYSFLFFFLTLAHSRWQQDHVRCVSLSTPPTPTPSTLSYQSSVHHTPSWHYTLARGTDSSGLHFVLRFYFSTLFLI
jgi:hypothetical protein